MIHTTNLTLVGVVVFLVLLVAGVLGRWLGSRSSGKSSDALGQIGIIQSALLGLLVVSPMGTSALHGLVATFSLHQFL